LQIVGCLLFNSGDNFLQVVKEYEKPLLFLIGLADKPVWQLPFTLYLYMNHGYLIIYI
jgi:hypothetical protein